MSENNYSDQEEESTTWKLDTIPPEIFLHICSFLSSKFVINVLSKVCRQFKEIVDNDVIWRLRISERWPKRYPICPVENINWTEACIAREEHYRLWSNNEENMKLYHIKDAHFGSVNVVQLLEDRDFCASGSRDRSVKLWNLNVLNDLEPSSSSLKKYNICLVYENENAHEGWVWSMAYDKFQRILYTGSFDHTIKLWYLDHLSSGAPTYRLTSPILCLAQNGKTLAAGCYNRIVSLLDPRANLQPVFQHVHHKKAVLCMATDEKYIISGSEDHKVIVFDKVAKKVQKCIDLESFPLCMCYNNGHILVGDLLGSFHIIDTTNQNFELVQTYKTGHKIKVTGIQHSLGSTITCSSDKTIRVLEPSADPQPIAVLQCASEVAKISCYDTTLVSANTDDSISIWMPKDS